MKTQYDRQKQNLNNQVELLSLFLNDEKLYFKCVDVVRPEMFTGVYRQIFDSFLSLIKDNKKPDIQSISKVANVPMDEVLTVNNYFSGAPIPIDVLLHDCFEHMANDRLLKLAASISTQVAAGTDYENTIEIITKTIQELQLGSTTSVYDMSKAITELMQIINHNRKSEQVFSGIPTGIRVIDTHMNGLHAGDLIVLAGETSHGKTSLALTMLFNSAVYYNYSCGIISHEMTPAKLTGRLAAYATNITSKHLLYGKLSDEELYDFNKKIPGLIRANIFIQDFIKRTLENTISAIRLLVMQHGCRFVVVENAGNITVKNRTDDEGRTAEISKSMKSVAMELGITVILISHLNRDQQGRKEEPTLSRLKHSGQLENDADAVLFIYRAELHGKEFFDGDSDDSQQPAAGMAKVYFAKGRDVGLAQTYMKFDEQTTYLTDSDGRQDVAF